VTTEACPYCRCPIEAEEPAVACTACSTRHHADCYEENGGCTIFGCRCGPPEEPKLSVSVPDLNSTAVAAAPALVAVAPPPPPPGVTVRATDPPVAPPNFQILADYGANAPAAAREAKKRTTFILLGALLGAVGAHNFYAGYKGKALTQLLITFFTLGFATPMTWLWAVIDICTVNKDSNGVEFES
jgi:TM2 domain-containing membrane protein YozV